MKDKLVFVSFLVVFFYFVFFNPNALGHPDNYIPADPLVTPLHIVPEWYLLPFYAILRSVPDKTYGLFLMVIAIVNLIFFPVSQKSVDCKMKVNPGIQPDAKVFDFYHEVHQILTCGLALVVILLGYIGSFPAEEPYVSVGFGLTCIYFFLLELIFWFRYVSFFSRV